MKSTLVSIGPAVLNGGISTLIGIIMLITSESHVFISYFKVRNQASRIFFYYSSKQKVLTHLKHIFEQLFLLTFYFTDIFPHDPFWTLSWADCVTCAIVLDWT